MELSIWELSREPSQKVNISSQFRKLQEKMRGQPDDLANLIGNESDME